MRLAMWTASSPGRIHSSTWRLPCRSLMQLAKYLYHDESQVQPAEGERSYSDLLVVRELRKMANNARKAGRW